MTNQSPPRRLIPPSPVRADAEFSLDRLERLWLSRRVAEEGPVGLIIALNPSRAGASDEETDHTITKEKEYARRWGWSGFWKANLFTHIETYSAKLKEVAYDTAVGRYGTVVLEAMIPLAPVIVCCWGSAVPKHKLHRIAAVCQRIRLMKRPEAPVMCFGVSKDGHPLHPLRLAYDTPLVPFQLPSGPASRRDEE